MNKQRLGVVIAGGLGLISTFLPWYSVMGFLNISGISVWHGWITAALSIVMIVMAVMGDRSTGLSGASKMVPMICAVLIALWGAFLMLGVANAMGASAGLGLILSIAAGAAGVVLPLVMKGGDNA